jgi:hypothetical protein
LILVLSSWPDPSAAFEGPSVRMRALGNGLAGFAPDFYTDMLRNPAYLTEREGSWATASALGGTGNYISLYNAGYFTNPTPFLGNAQGGLLVSVGQPAVVSEVQIVPFEFFLPPIVYPVLNSTEDLDDWYPYPRSTHEFLLTRTESAAGSFFYSLRPGTSRFSYGVNYTYARNALGAGPDREEASASAYGSLYRSAYHEDERETFHRLKTGLLFEADEKTLIELSVGMSKNDAVSHDRNESTSENYENGVLDRRGSTLQDTRWDPFRRKRISAAFFLHRRGERSRFSFMLAAGAGDGYWRGRDESTYWWEYFEPDTTVTNTSADLRTASTDDRISAYQAGIGGMRESGSRKTLVFYALTYAFVNADSTYFEDIESDEITARVQERRHANTHMLVASMALEQPAWQHLFLRVGSSFAGKLVDSDAESFAEYPGVDTVEANGTSQVFSGTMKVTGGLGYEFGERASIHIASQDLADLDEWNLEFFSSF